MKRLLSRTLLLAFTALFISACSSTPDNNFKNNDKKLIDLIKHFQSYGVVIESVQALESHFFHAEEALAVNIDGKEIGIYRFDLNFKKAKIKVDKVAQRGTFYIQAIPFPAVINGSFMMISHDTHKRSKEFVKIFKSFTEQE